MCAFLDWLHGKPEPRTDNYLPGDLVKIDLGPNDICNDSHNGKGVVIYGPDDSHYPGWIVASAPGSLRCVASELTMITPREDR